MNHVPRMVFARDSRPPWVKHYPEGVPSDIDASKYGSLIDMLEDTFARFCDRDAFICEGTSITYRDLEQMSRALAAFLQSAGLRKGDRIALLMPNVLQYPVSVAAILRAGYVVVNLVPLGTSRELRYQLVDSGAKVLIVDERFAARAQTVVANTHIEQILLTSTGEFLGAEENVRSLAEFRAMKKPVPQSLPAAISFSSALKTGRKMTLAKPKITSGDVAFIQYNFGRLDGMSRGATSLHRNIVASALQCEAWIQPALCKPPRIEQVLTVCALPFYQLSTLIACFLVSMRVGGVGLLISDPADRFGFVKVLKQHQINVFPAANTLCRSLLVTPGFEQVDFSKLKVCFGGGVATQRMVADAWRERTGSALCDTYILSRTSLPITCNPVEADGVYNSLGLPLPSTSISIRDDENNEVAVGQVGEICVKGPQLMFGHWYRQNAIAAVTTDDGYVRTGDIGLMRPDGYIRKI